MTEKHIQLIQHETPYKVELTRGQRGGYGWTITVRAINVAELFEVVQLADQNLRRVYGGATEDTTR